MHAVLSRNMYSLHGLLALMRPSFGQVCQALMVVSYWTPGSAQCHAASVTWPHSSRACSVLAGLPSVRRVSDHGPSASTASMKASVMRMELLLFWPLTV